MEQGSQEEARGGRRAAATLAVACICGWLMMELEILGARVLTPYFGSAIYVVMGSVIGVFLLCLSGGYMLGGWLSRGRRSQHWLGLNLCVAGLYLLVMPVMIDPLCGGLRDTGLDVKWGSLLAALGLFGVPTLLLGTVSPTAVRWLTRRAGDSGLYAGLVLAASTVASFGGTIVTAFYLLRFSTKGTIRISGGVLFALGGLVLVLAALGVRLSPEPPGGSQEGSAQ